MLTPFLEGIKVLSDGDSVEARALLFAVWEAGGNDSGSC